MCNGNLFVDYLLLNFKTHLVEKITKTQFHVVYLVAVSIIAAKFKK